MLRKGILQTQAGSAVAGTVVLVLMVMGTAVTHPREQAFEPILVCVEHGGRRRLPRRVGGSLQGDIHS